MLHPIAAAQGRHLRKTGAWQIAPREVNYRNLIVRRQQIPNMLHVAAPSLIVEPLESDRLNVCRIGAENFVRQKGTGILLAQPDYANIIRKQRHVPADRN